MVRLGLYIEVRHPDLDCSCIESGNPGLGGTQYQMLLLAYHLANTYKDKFNVYLFVDEKVKFANDHITQVQLLDKGDLREEIVKSNISVLIVRSELDILRCLEKLPIKIVTWSHNFFNYDLAEQIAKQTNVSVNVFVGKQQYDVYIDDDVIEKSTFIFNMVPSSDVMPKRKSSKNVIFIGALIPAKGFHILASMWKYILSNEPDAQLYVLGSGNLYGGIKELGRYGLAEKNYEDGFMRYLTDDKGNILPSVHFEGVVGNNKVEYYLNASVGALNLNGARETFGLVAAELEACGVPVVTYGRGSYADIIQDGITGYICNSRRDIVEKLLLLLGNKSQNILMGEAAYINSQKFSQRYILPQWVSLIESVEDGSLIVDYIKPIPPYRNNFKWLIVIVRFMRYNMGMKWLPSTIQLATFVRKLLKRSVN